MKKNFYFLLLLLASFFASMRAADTFYVNPFADNTSDDNAGTKSAPWATLNPGKWTDGCTVVIQSLVKRYHRNASVFLTYLMERQLR